MYQVRIEQRSRALGDGFLVAPGFVVTTAAAVRDAGPAVELLLPGEDGAAGSGTGAGETVAAEVIEVLGEDGLALLEVVAPGFRALPAPAGPGAALTRPGHAPIRAHDLGDQLLRFPRLGAARLHADLNGPFPPARPADTASPDPAGPDAAEHSAARPESAGHNAAALDSAALDSAGHSAGGQDAGRQDAGRNGLAAGPGADDAVAGNERAALLLDYLRERARSGRLDPVVTVPGLGAGEGSR